MNLLHFIEINFNPKSTQLMKPNPNLPPQHQQMQVELYARIDAQHRKERDQSLVFKLKIILFAAVVLIACIGVSKCQSEQAAKQKEQELKQTIECK